MLSYSERESAAFGLNIYRFSDINFPVIDLLKNELESCNCDVLICRISTEHQSRLAEFNKMGHDLIFADTLMEYSFKIPKRPIERRIGIASLSYVQVKTNEDFRIIDSLANVIFEGYSSHYQSNPLLRNVKASFIYKDWLKNIFEGTGIIFIAKIENEPVGFFSGVRDNDVFRGGPAGILPQYEGLGIYFDAHLFLPGVLKTMGFNRCISGTQVYNHVVQSQWNLLGWKIYRSSYTLHINSKLGSLKI